MQEHSNWSWKHQSLQRNTIVTSCTIPHPCIDVVIITYVQEIPKTGCNMIQANKSIQIHHIFMTDSNYDYIFYEIVHVSDNSDKE